MPFQRARALLQRLLPPRVKAFLRPYLRRYLPNDHTHFASFAALQEHLASRPPTPRPAPASISLPLAPVTRLCAGTRTQGAAIVYRGTLGEQACIDPTLQPPDPYVARLNDIYLLAGTRYLMDADAGLIHDEEYRLHEMPGAAVKYNLAQQEAPGRLNIQFALRQAAWLDTGINVMHEYSNNYFHFVAETIPRLLLAEEAGIPAKVPYLVEDNLHPNIACLYELVVRTQQRPTLRLTPGTLFHSRELYMPSDMTLVVDAYQGGDIARQSSLNAGRIRLGVERCKQAFALSPASRRRKIFASRSGNYRRLLNQSELENRFAALGFEVVDTGKLDLETQIRLFQEAEIVVGPTGAQMTNIVWCQPGARAIILASDHPSHQLYLWELLGQVSGTEVEIILGPRAYNIDGLHGVHDDYTVPPENIIALL